MSTANVGSVDAGTLLIPKLIHQIWAGPNPFPDKYRALTDTWTKLHPGWVYKLWTDATLPLLINQALFDAMSNMVGRSDIARYELIYKYGGLYCDMDYEAKQNLEPLIANDTTIFFATEKQPDGVCQLTGSLFGAVPGHPSIRGIIDLLPVCVERHRDDLLVYQVGPPVINAVLGNTSAIVRLSPEHVSPYSWWDKTNRDPDPVGAYAVHHYHGSWK